ncbi:MAG: A/G-specific adenine glycosylase [Acutalibacteraceae bacterium]
MNHQELQSALSLIIDWYQKTKRDLPWRQDPSPYHVWLSETMLQQTRIETVIPYYQRFLAELPTIESLAEVDDDKLMKLWEGLGYYSRVRNLKKAAQKVVSLYGGLLPATATELQKLPGIGEYTAGAIASIAFGQPEPAVDGNVLRVIMRLTACDEDIMQPKVKKNITALLREIYPDGTDASDLTQGIMELGEVVCIPNGEPKCALCPLRAVCRAHLAGETARYPVRSAKKQRKAVNLTVFILSCGDQFALHRRPDNGLLAGMWEFPNTEGPLTQEEAKKFLKQIGIVPTACQPCGKAKHIFTHIEWHMKGYQVKCQKKIEQFEWKTAEEITAHYALPSAFRFYLKLLEEDFGEE